MGEKNMNKEEIRNTLQEITAVLKRLSFLFIEIIAELNKEDAT